MKDLKDIIDEHRKDIYSYLLNLAKERKTKLKYSAEELVKFKKFIDERDDSKLNRRIKK